MYSQVKGVGPSRDGDEQDDRSSGDALAEAAAPSGPSAWAAGGGVIDEGDVPPPAPAIEEAASQVVPRPTPVSSLLSEIARAMQVAADQERERIDASVGEDENAQVEKIHTRAAAESDELKKQADKDVSLVNAWRAEQMQRIRDDADRQIDDRRAQLEQSLTHHGSLIQAEVQSVHVAVAGYRASLGEFFGRLSQEPDPSEIARLAGTLPDPPDLHEVRADARSDAMKELEQRSAAETRDLTAESLATVSDSSGLGSEPVGVMAPGVAQGAGSASQPPWDAEWSEAGATASPPESLPSHESVALRLIHSLTSRTSPREATEDQ